MAWFRRRPVVFRIEPGQMFIIDRRAYRVYKNMLKELKVKNLRRK